MGISYHYLLKEPRAELPGPRLKELIQRLQIKYLIEDRAENAVAAIRVATVAWAAVVPALITTPESFAEVVLIVAEVDVVSVVSVARILVPVSFLGTEAIAVLPIRLTRVEPFLVTIVDRATQHLRAVLVRLVVRATAIVTIVVRTVVVVTPLFEP